MATATKTRKAGSKTLTPGMTEVGRLLRITKQQLIQLNQESIRLNYNRNLHPGPISQLPDQKYVVGTAYRHIGFNGRNHNNVNYRLEVLLCEKRAGDPTFTPDDLFPVFLDITPEAWEKLKAQKTAA